MGKESTCNAADTDLIPESGRSPGGGNGNPIHYSCLGNPVDREAWHAIYLILNLTFESITHDYIAFQPKTQWLNRNNILLLYLQEVSLGWSVSDSNVFQAP